MSKVLTVSIAAYNVENYIQKALDSLLDPAINSRVEVLVCDDGGTDGTLAIAQKYADLYPGTVIPIHKENGGYGSVLNTNVARATGKYFKVLDGDDWFVKENFIEFVDLLDHIDADYVVSDMSSFYETGEVYREIHNLDYMAEGGYPFDRVEFRHLIGMHSSTFRTSLLKNLPKAFTEHCFYTDNELVQYTVPYLDTIYLWHHVIYIYRHGRAEASNSKDGIKRHYKEQQEVFWRVYEIYRALDERLISKQQFVRNRLVFEVANIYRFLSYFSPATANYREMRDFRAELRVKCPELIPLAMKEGRLARLFLQFGAAAYPFMHILHMGSEWMQDVKRRVFRKA